MTLFTYHRKHRKHHFNELDTHVNLFTYDEKQYLGADVFIDTYTKRFYQ